MDARPPATFELPTSRPITSRQRLMWGRNEYPQLWVAESTRSNRKYRPLQDETQSRYEYARSCWAVVVRGRVEIKAVRFPLCWAYPVGWQDSGSVSIQYNNRAVAKIPLPAFYHDRAAGHPVWAYLDDTWTSCHRHYFHEDRKRPDWYATAAIKNIRNSPIDPLHIAVLIALAQRSRKHGTDLPQRVCGWYFQMFLADFDTLRYPFLSRNIACRL